MRLFGLQYLSPFDQLLPMLLTQFSQIKDFYFEAALSTVSEVLVYEDSQRILNSKGFSFHVKQLHL
jgi:hypothetical protein